VVKQVLDMGHEVIASDFRFDGVDPRAEQSRVSLFSGDKDIYEQFGKPDACIHLAWRDGFVHNSPAHMSDLSKHIEFCGNMMSGGLPILSVMGTMHEVGYWEGAINEGTPCKPQSMMTVWPLFLMFRRAASLPPMRATSSSLTILTTCWAGVRLSMTS